MSENLPEFQRMNATGIGEQDLRSDEGGNNSRGVLDNVRPTGIVGTGRKNSKSSRDMGKRK